MSYKHIPVLLQEALEYLDPKPGQDFIDCTLGGGGHTFAIAERVAPGGRVLAIDLDKLAIGNAERIIHKKKYKNIIIAHDNFRNLQHIVKIHWPGKRRAPFDGIVLDLGLSSAQLQDRCRGFSFQLDAPLEMAFGNRPSDTCHKSTQSILQTYTRKEFERIFKEYGEERYAGRIAAAITEARKEGPIRTTKQLVGIIESTVPEAYRRGRIHCATRTFQALRIATNDELSGLREVLPQALDLLKQGGRIVVISYHSLEDRIVKNFFRQESKDCLCPAKIPECVCGHRKSLGSVTKKPVVPTAAEIRTNPRSRSAKLRVAEKK